MEFFFSFRDNNVRTGRSLDQAVRVDLAGVGHFAELTSDGPDRVTPPSTRKLSSLELTRYPMDQATHMD